MKEIQSKISALIKTQFPSFYLDEGEDFVSFVEAYYEWLESNYQQLELRSTTNFDVGDVVTQGNTTGTIIDANGSNIIVSVNNFDAFRCNVQCDEFLPLSSTSGGNTFIEKQYKLNPLHWGRKLFTIRDIDSTLEQFIVHFKEKYLKNIEFEVNTNKRLLVKNSYDLYRSKGTERSIDLFFRLVYGSSAKVYYPGDDVMRLSAAEWVKPVYLEVTSSPRTISLVGKQITGVTSGATAFVEKYIKRRVSGGFVYVLYLSNVAGTFVNDELLKADTYFSNLPTVSGSLSSVSVQTGSSLFAVGDIVTFISTKGVEAKGRVSSIANQTGIVSFELIDGGWGYTVSGPSATYVGEADKRSQSIVSTATLQLSNVVTSNVVAGFNVISGGTGYANGEVVTVQSAYVNATGQLVVNSGVITGVVLTKPGSGFFTSSPTVTIATSGGSSADITATTQAHGQYFEYFEPFTQRLAEVTYDSATNNQLFIAGQAIHIGNSETNLAFGTIISNANNTLVNANGILTIAIANNGLFGTSNTVTLTSNDQVNATITAITNTSVTSNVMGIPVTANLSVTAITNVAAFSILTEVYQEDEQSVECANAVIVDTIITGASGTISVEEINGVFRRGRSLLVRNSTAAASLNKIDLTVGLYSNSGAFINTFNAPIFSTNTATIANVEIVSGGSGASFKVGSISDSEIIYLNTDLIGGLNDDDDPYLSKDLANVAYGFPKNPSGNSESVIFDCLNFDSFNIGTISSLIEVNPGSGYTTDPYVLVYQPFLTAFDKRDYVIRITAPTGAFLDGERILQTNTLLTKTTLVLDDETGLAVGEFVVQDTASGIVDTIQATANTIIVKDVQGTFQVNATPLTSGSNVTFSTAVTAVSTNSSITSTAKGIVKSANATHVTVKRIQFDELFEPGLDIVGQISGTSAEIVTVSKQENVRQIGLNANVEANVVTANGTVTGIQIIDSGVGYRDDSEITYVSADGLRAGTVIANVAGLGVGSGYYKTTNGFLSSTSRVHDSDFYQEYSYEVLSQIPLDRYAEMFKKVMHVAGTRFFGGVLLETEIQSTVQYADSSITYA